MIRTRQAPAFVFDLDEHTFGTGAHAQGDGSLRSRELEGVLQQVADDRHEHLAIPLDGEVLIHRQNRQSEADRMCVQHRRGGDFVDELVQPDRLMALDSLRETNLGERAANQRAQSEETAMEYAARAAGNSHVSGSENLKRQNRGVEQVSQLVCEEFQSVGAPPRAAATSTVD